MDFKGKVALVTGGASGIGRAYCEELLKHGAKVSICDLDLDAGDELVEQLKEIYGQESAIFCQCDVTDYPQFEESFQMTISTFGHLDIVINNAGIMNDRFWELQVDVNLNGVIRGTLLALRFLGKDQGYQGGILVNTASSAYFRPQVSTPIYTATQHAVVGLSRSYGFNSTISCISCRRTGVRVIALCPGWTSTALVGDIKNN
ncbi:15-hydroxyprostaglandin dehydrogenase [NAD(+)]-like [Ctenocephalides felis]|uniref:15-hydroxyprostaglandin dehydrogenase [NAD(+)]-like n=1 Tax=Ctenocephalides felis TaxID=7515 RepID=UPI000E6E2703|nr:15-hydroxyprostaglandin dehydrogenase [NAD(+)]-like [Ctenocephalides felis]